MKSAPPSIPNQAEDGQPAVLAPELEAQPAGSSVLDDAILATGVDLARTAGVGGLHSPSEPVCRVVVEVPQSVETRTSRLVQRRLRMRPKQFVTTMAESREGIGAGEAIEVSHASPPVGEVEIRLDERLSHRRCCLADRSLR